MIMMFENKEAAQEICDDLYEIFGGSVNETIADLGHSFLVQMTLLDRNTGIWFEDGKRKYVVEMGKLARDRSIDIRPMTYKDLLTWFKAEMVKRDKWK